LGGHRGRSETIHCRELQPGHRLWCIVRWTGAGDRVRRKNYARDTTEKRKSRAVMTRDSGVRGRTSQTFLGIENRSMYWQD
jgi:hypothetical protein